MRILITNDDGAAATQLPALGLQAVAICPITIDRTDMVVFNRLCSKEQAVRLCACCHARF